MATIGSSKAEHIVEEVALATCALRKLLLNARLSPEGQDTARRLTQKIIDWQHVLGEIRELIEIEDQ